MKAGLNGQGRRHVAHSSDTDEAATWARRVTRQGRDRGRGTVNGSMLNRARIHFLENFILSSSQWPPTRVQTAKRDKLYPYAVCSIAWAVGFPPSLFFPIGCGSRIRQAWP